MLRWWPAAGRQEGALGSSWQRGARRALAALWNPDSALSLRLGWAGDGCSLSFLPRPGLLSASVDRVQSTDGCLQLLLAREIGS